MWEGEGEEAEAGRNKSQAGSGGCRDGAKRNL